MLNIQNEVHEFHHKVVGKKIGGSGAKPTKIQGVWGPKFQRVWRSKPPKIQGVWAKPSKIQGFGGDAPQDSGDLGGEAPLDSRGLGGEAFEEPPKIRGVRGAKPQNEVLPGLGAIYFAPDCEQKSRLPGLAYPD